MIRKLTFAVTFIVLMCTLSFAFDFQQVKSEVRTNEVPEGYAKIQDAINAANPGDTIFVGYGTYNEHVVINKTISLVGENWQTTIIDGNGTGNAVEVTADDVTIIGFTIRNSGNQANDSGIALNQVKNCTIAGNNITENSSNGMWLYLSSNNNITGNHIADNYDGIYLKNSSNNTLAGNNIAKNWDGIVVGFSSSNNITRNEITANDYYGIWLYSSFTNSIYGNNITTDNNDGIYLDSSSNNNISGNNVTGNEENGIWLNFSSSNSITRNIIVDNNDGIAFGRFSTDNSIAGNNITANRGRGIIFIRDTIYNDIIGNVIADNEYGVWLYYSSKTSIFHNNFIENQNHVYAFDSFNDSWDDGYPSGGNYWSDYAGIDEKNGPNQGQPGSDGIGDTLYTVNSNYVDNYPIMGLFSDFDATSESHIQTICNSTISDFRFNGTAISFNVSGETGSIGFCRICIPMALMSTTYKVLVNGVEVSYSLLSCSHCTSNYLYFTYVHSTKNVVIIPEFPSLIILQLLMAPLLTIIVCRRKHSK